MPRDLASSSGFVPGLVKNVRLLEWTTWNSRGGRKKKKISAIRHRPFPPSLPSLGEEINRSGQIRTISNDFLFFLRFSSCGLSKKERDREREKEKKFEGNDTILTPITCWRCAARVLKQRRKGMVISIHG